ncbi:hypothetical protein D3C74_358190 [compost metagenome]
MAGAFSKVNDSPVASVTVSGYCVLKSVCAWLWDCSCAGCCEVPVPSFVVALPHPAKASASAAALSRDATLFQFLIFILLFSPSLFVLFSCIVLKLLLPCLGVPVQVKPINFTQIHSDCSTIFRSLLSPDFFDSLFQRENPVISVCFRCSFLAESF